MYKYSNKGTIPEVMGQIEKLIADDEFTTFEKREEEAEQAMRSEYENN